MISANFNNKLTDFCGLGLNLRIMHAAENSLYIPHVVFFLDIYQYVVILLS